MERSFYSESNSGWVIFQKYKNFSPSVHPLNIPIANHRKQLITTNNFMFPH